MLQIFKENRLKREIVNNYMLVGKVTATVAGMVLRRTKVLILF